MLNVNSLRWLETDGPLDLKNVIKIIGRDDSVVAGYWEGHVPIVPTQLYALGTHSNNCYMSNTDVAPHFARPYLSGAVTGTASALAERKTPSVT